MLIEVKVKVKRTIDNKTKSKSETYLTDKQVFGEAEYAVMQTLSKETGVVDYEIQSIKLSPIKELYNIEDGENTFITTLIDSYIDDKGNEKTMKYKVLLWADNLTTANQRTQSFTKQGYDLTVEGLTQKDIIYLQ